MTKEELDRHVWCPVPHRGEEPCDWCEIDAAVLAEMAKDAPCEVCEGPRGVRGAFGLRTTSAPPVKP